MTQLDWREGLRQCWGVRGYINAEEQSGRRYFHVSVSFPEESKWWPRTTETGSVQEARDWIEEQENEYRAQVIQKAAAR